MKTMKTTFLMTGALAAVTLTAACGSTATTGSGTTNASQVAVPASPMPSDMSSDMASPMTSASPFGPGCSAIPTSGPGSVDGMSAEPVATAASNNPELSTLVTAVKKAGLVDTLNSAKDITVFAPSNEAFAAVPKDDLDDLLADKAKLTKVLTYHVVQGRMSPDQLEKAKMVKTLEGGELTIAGSDDSLTVNGAGIVCGDVPTANATVYIIDKVLMPE